MVSILVEKYGVAHAAVYEFSCSEVDYGQGCVYVCVRVHVYAWMCVSDGKEDKSEKREEQRAERDNIKYTRHNEGRSHTRIDLLRNHPSYRSIPPFSRAFETTLFSRPYKTPTESYGSRTLADTNVHIWTDAHICFMYLLLYVHTNTYTHVHTYQNTCVQYTRCSERLSNTICITVYNVMYSILHMSYVLWM